MFRHSFLAPSIGSTIIVVMVIDFIEHFTYSDTNTNYFTFQSRLVFESKVKWRKHLHNYSFIISFNTFLCRVKSIFVHLFTLTIS